jgi:uncharacterized protein (DUF305 family)
VGLRRHLSRLACPPILLVESLDSSEGVMVRRRLGCWIVLVVVAAGCGNPSPDPPTASEQTDVWFMQHMVPHLRQTTSVVELTRRRITRPELTRLADTINQQGNASLQQLQGWLDRRGLAPHGHSHALGSRKETDLERLSRVHATRFDLVFFEVMTARHHAGVRLAVAELRDGSVPEVRRLARQMLAEQQAQIELMNRWSKAWPAVVISRSSRLGRSDVSDQA